MKFNLNFIIIVFILHCITTYLVHHIGDYHYDEEKAKARNLDEVWDLCHYVFPNIHHFEMLINVLLVILLIPLLTSSSKISMLQELLYYFPLIILIRSLMVIATILPRHKKCNYSLNPFVFINGHCYDKIFSGHTAAIFLMSLIYLKYGIISFKQLFLINLLGAFLIIASRAHYTIDVMISYFITYAVYNNCFT